MASVSKSKADGGRRVLVVCPDGVRRALRLGAVSPTVAHTLAGHVESLSQARRLGQAPPNVTAAWLAACGPSLRERLAVMDLCDTAGSPTVAELFDHFIRARSDVKDSTAATYRTARKHAVAYFKHKRARKVTPGDAKQFRRWLTDDYGLAAATARRTIKTMKLVWNHGTDHRLTDANPFAAISSAALANAERMRFIAEADSVAVLDALPDAQWRLLFGLARWGGLRVGSEPRGLRWSDVNLAVGRFLVRSPKTEHHEGKGERWVPIFPELRPLFDDALDVAEPSEPLVLPFLVGRTDQALRKPMQHAIKLAGLTAWPKLWQNLRSTRETELADRFPGHVITAWIGNSQKVAEKHYLQVTDAHFIAATGAETGDAESDARPVGRGRKCAARASPEREKRHCEEHSAVSMCHIGLEPITR